MVDIADAVFAVVDHPAIAAFDGEFRVTLDFRIHGIGQVIIFASCGREVSQDHTDPDVGVFLPELLQTTVNSAVKLPLVAHIESIHALAEQILNGQPKRSVI